MSKYEGKHFLNDVIYRAADGLANSDAQMIENNPGNFMWSKSAPRNGAKSKTTDIGTALHCAILEPEKYKDHIQNGLFTGFDFDSTMLRIGAMNMMLHGIDDPNIKHQDTLGNSPHHL